MRDERQRQIRVNPKNPIQYILGVSLFLKGFLYGTCQKNETLQIFLYPIKANRTQLLLLKNLNGYYRAFKTMNKKKDLNL